ncbi:ATP-binding protein [Aeromonas media]|uniref:ATP-binding protein n=1 Tax=Aeromonas media TaxID=651 RepID=UPI0038D1E520
MGYRQQRPKIGLTVCPDLVDHYTGGLGLAIVKSIMQSHRGHVEVSSNEGGTLFELFFPLSGHTVP